MHRLIPTTPVALNTLRLGLALSAIGWGISFFFTFAPWRAATLQLYGMGANAIEYQPLLDYWLKMASSVFGCIGVASALASFRPRHFASLIVLLAPFHFIVGTTLLVAAGRNQMSPRLHPTFIPDVTFCFIVGILLLIPLASTCSRRKTAFS